MNMCLLVFQDGVVEWFELDVPLKHRELKSALRNVNILSPQNRGWLFKKTFVIVPRSLCERFL